MKANEAPEKIYLQQYDENTLICLNKWNVSEEWSNKPLNEKVATNIEYTRTDAFIEKACEWLFNRANIYTKLTVDSHDGSVYAGFYSDKMVEDFKKAMEM